MLYVGTDLHKSSISFCVVAVEDGNRIRVVRRRRLLTCDPQAIVEFLEELGEEVELVVEATASYEWFVALIEDLVSRIVLAHPGKLRVIAESVRKSDKIDAYVLAEFLARNQIPEAWRPTPRVREHRLLVRQRHYWQSRVTSVKCRVRHLLSDHNADLPGLFDNSGISHSGQLHLTELKQKLADSELFVLEQLIEELEFCLEKRKQTERQLAAFAKQATIREQEARKLLATAPGVGTVATEVILSELGDVRRFSSQSKLAAYAGLAPGFRESDGKRRDLQITKQGSKLLRWIMVEVAWSAVRNTARWKRVYEGLKRRCGSKKAIVAVARRLLCVLGGMLSSGQPYDHAHEQPSRDAA
jgi:transposase